VPTDKSKGRTKCINDDQTPPVRHQVAPYQASEPHKVFYAEAVDQSNAGYDCLSIETIKHEGSRFGSSRALQAFVFMLGMG
jgi:hypothetical protein